MQMPGAHICFVGPLPPPVHGFSEINRRMLAVLRLQHQVRVFDMAPRGGGLGSVLQWLRFAAHVLRHKPDALYIALSGGMRQWVDLAFVLLARLRGMPVFVHHHSFAYLGPGRPSRVMRFKAMHNAIHVALCECMGERLAHYGIAPGKLRTLSNAAFLDDIAPPVVQPGRASSAPLRVGFLSNITAEKGIFEFFSVLSAAGHYGLALQGVVAGPVSPEVVDAFQVSLASTPNTTHIGPVYGADKAAFWGRIDVLFFPTRYPNEAEPVTILEALAYGVPVVAFARGCIDGMVPAAAGAVFPYSERFIAQTLDVIRPLAASPSALTAARVAARQAFESHRTRAKTTLQALVTEMGRT